MDYSSSNLTVLFLSSQVGKKFFLKHCIRKTDIVQRLDEIIRYSENRRSLRVSPGPPAIAQMNRFSGDNFFLQHTPSFSSPF